MALNDDFIKAVSDKRMWAVYQRLSDIMPIDPSLKTQDEMLKYAEENLTELYQPHDGEVLNTDSAKWTKEYYDDEKYRLENNFSRERLSLLRDMTKYRYADTIKYRADQERERQHKEHSHQQVKIARSVGGGVAVAGTVAAGIGIAVGSTAATFVGIAAVVGGITLVVSSS